MAPSNTAVDEADVGLKVLSTNFGKLLVDIVIVHGLQGHYLRSFTHTKGTCWIKDLLPEDLPSARILSYGYDASLQASRDGLFADGQALVGALYRLRRKKEEEKRRPLIFVVHSSGGLVVKHALIKSSRATPSNNPHYIDIKRSTIGIIFLGTPHQGVTPEYLEQFSADPDHPILTELRWDSNHLSQQNEEYKAILRGIKTTLAYEKNISSQHVSKSHADIAGATNIEKAEFSKDHLSLGKYYSRDDAAYQTVLGWLAEMIEERTRS